MENFEENLRAKGKCCITEKPLADSKYINIIQLHIRASWSFPVWGSFVTGESNMAGAYVHDDAIVNNNLIGPVKYAVEFDGDEIKYHNIRTCRECGCREDDACIHPKHGNCWWVEIDLCSHCAQYPGEAKRHSQLKINQ